MMDDDLIVARHTSVVRVQLNRPERGNALSPALVAGLTTLLDELHRDGSVRLLILSGMGRHFCTGFDLSDLEDETDDTLLARFVRIELMLQKVARAPFATVALAHGRVTGAGADLFAACFERWIVDDARFAFPGSAFGLVLGTARLADIVGPASAGEWLEGGRVIDASLATAAGLATLRTPSSALESRLQELVDRVSRLDGPAQRAIRAALADRARPRGRVGDDADLTRLVHSAARPGLKKRIIEFRKRSK